MTGTQIARALLPQRVLHRACQHVHRGPAVAGLADFRLQQNVLPQPGGGEAAPVGARLLLHPVGVGRRRRPAGERPHLRGEVVQVHGRGLARAADGSVDDPVEGPVGGVVGGEHADRLLDEVGVVGRRLLRRRAVERRQVGVGVHLGQPDVGPVVARRGVDVERLERVGERATRTASARRRCCPPNPCRARRSSPRLDRMGGRPPGRRTARPTARPTPARATVRMRLDLRRQLDVDVAAGGLGIRAHAVRLLHQLLGGALLEAGQVADQVGVDAEAALGVLAEADLGGDAGGVVEVDLLVARDQAQRAEEAGGVAGREQLFGVGALAVAAHLLRRTGVQIDPAVVDFTWPSRPPPVAVDSAVKTTSMLMGLIMPARPPDGKTPRCRLRRRCARTPSSTFLPRSGSTLRQYSNTRDSTGSRTPSDTWPMMLSANRSRASSSSTSRTSVPAWPQSSSSWRSA